MNKVDPELLNYCQNITKTQGESAEHIINYVLPEKIKKLSTLSQELLHASVLDSSEIKINVYDNVIECNPTIMTFLPVIKNELYDFLDMCITLKFWIQLNVPKMEEGNNFGVEVQGDMLEMLDEGRSSTSTLLESLSSYFADRGETIQDILKTPYIIDIDMSCSYLDQRAALSLRHGIMDLRNSYCVLYDKLTKNFEKIKQPKGSHQEHDHFEILY
ncbi:hypothetical protein WA158_007302 [Blastocystis sp. Blastoise]